MRLRWNWCRALSALVVVGGMAHANAEDASDPAAAGYALDHTSVVAGMFSGCDKDRQIAFADGTRFACAEHFQHFAFEPKVRLYRDASGLNWLVVIDGRAYAGSIIRLRDRDLARPRAVSQLAPLRPTQRARPGDLPPVFAVTPDSGIAANNPIDPAGAIAYPGRREPSSNMGTSDK